MAILNDIFRKALLATPKRTEGVNIVPLQIDENGQYDPAASAALDLRIKQATTPMTLQEKLLTGRELSQDYQAVNPNTGEAEMATVANKRSGLIPDVVSGFRENYAQGFNANNLAPQNKGFATRLGEGLGTIGRFADSPLGRGLIAYGLSNAVGDTNPLEQAITAGVGRQGNIARNKVYGEALNKMGYEDNLIGGYNYTDDMLKNLADIKQLQENAEYRKLYLENQRIQNELMNQYRRDQLKAQELERAAQREDRAATRALTARGQNLNYDVAMKKLEADAKKETAAERKEKTKLKQAQNTINMISKAKETVQNNPNAFGYIQGALGADVSNRLFKGGTQARSTINSVAAEYRKYLTGAQMSDRERLDYEKFLPSPKDNAKILNDKLNAMLDVISAREGIETKGRGVTNVGNYKVRVKQ